MPRLILLLGGSSIAAVLAVAFAALFFTGGAATLILSLGVVCTVVLAGMALRTRFGSVAMSALAVVFAMYAGVQMAQGLGGPGHWLAAVGAIAAAMFCGSIVALQRLNQRTRSPRAAASQGDPVLDSTLEMEVCGETSRATSARPFERSAPSWRPALALTVAGLLGFTALTMVPPRAEQSPVASGNASAAASAGTDPLADAGLVTRADAHAVVETTLPEEAPAVAGAPVVATQQAASPPLSTKLVSRTVAPSLARRGCLAQVESAHLFMNIARQSASASVYARLTNMEIKRFAASRPVDPYTLQHIAQDVWERRQEPERGPSWWSRQYARCEEARIDGGAYVVRG